MSPRSILRHSPGPHVAESSPVKGQRVLGLGDATVGDEDKLGAWLADEVRPVELSDKRLREAQVARCQVERRIPAPTRLDRNPRGCLSCVRAAVHLSLNRAASALATSRWICSSTR
jgi:hypothetical protein